MGLGPDTRYRYPHHPQNNHVPTTSHSAEGPPGRREPPGTLETAHGTQPGPRPPCHRPPRPRQRPPPPLTDSERPPPEGCCTVLERGHYCVVSAAASPGPQPNGPRVLRGTNTRLARWTNLPRGRRRRHCPTQGPQAHPPTRRPGPGARPGPNHLRSDGLPPRTGHAQPVPLDQVAYGHPRRPLPASGPIPSLTHKSRQALTHRRTPPRPQQPLTCVYHAVQTVLRRWASAHP